MRCLPAPASSGSLHRSITQRQRPFAAGLVVESCGFVALVEDIRDPRLQGPVGRKGVFAAHIEGGEAAQPSGVGEVVVTAALGDTGETQMEPAEVKVATCLLKPDAFKNKFPIDYQCFSIPNEFVVGYGLDYDGLGRNSSDIYKILEA